MKKIFWILFFFSCTKNHKIANDLVNLRAIRVNKNYIFCSCINRANKDYFQKRNLSYQDIDGSGEIYFIDSLYGIDLDKLDLFLYNYLDSLDRNNIYLSYNDKSLNLSRCLELYNSSSLEKFVNENLKNSEID